MASIVESLETRRLFAYSPGDVITNAFNGPIDIVFDVKTIGTEQKVLIGKESDGTAGTATLVNDDGTEGVPFAPPAPQTGNVFSFGYDVAFVGDSLAIAAYNDALGPVFYIYDPAGGAYDTTPDHILLSPEGNQGFFPLIDNFGSDLLVRDAGGVYVLDAAGDENTPPVHSFTVDLAANAASPGTDAIASFGDDILVATQDGTDTYIVEISPNDTERRFNLPGGIRPVTVAYGENGEVFVGDVQAGQVDQYKPRALDNVAAPTLVKSYPPVGVGFARALAVSGDHLLVGQSASGGLTSVQIYDHTQPTVTLVDTISSTSGTFGSVAVRAASGFAIGDAATDGGTIQFYTFEADPPPGPGAVTVTGTPGAETILVRIVNGSLEVVVNGVVVDTFSVGDVSEVLINAGGGADTITSDTSNTLATIVHGGEGNDTITGGGGNDVLYGDGGDDHVSSRHGSDVALGGDGNDRVRGGAGRDVLIGGDGRDDIEGNAADDILVAGSSSYDADATTIRLAVLRDTWLSTNAYAVRIAAVQGIADFSVSADGDVDTVQGGSGMDWFLIQDEDVLQDWKRTETVDETV